MHWTEAWIRSAASRFWRSRERGSIISEEAVMVGVVATLGLGAVVAFVTGLGGVLTKALGQISGQVP